jgi:hypothetical protein
MAGAAPTPPYEYKSNFPDTLLPCLEYKDSRTIALKIAAPADAQGLLGSRAAAAAVDSFELRSGAGRFGMHARLDSASVKVGEWYYRVTAPCNAGPGDYDLYSPDGVLVERNMTHVADVVALEPTLGPVVPEKGLRGSTYEMALQGSGLIFGALPDAATYVSSPVPAYLERGAARMGLSFRTAPSPYRASYGFHVPETADTGAYRLVVERADGHRTIREDAFRVWIPPEPRVSRIDPDSLANSIQTTFTITGADMDFGVLTGSATYMGLEAVREVFLRHGDRSVSTQAYPIPPAGPGPVIGMKASFLTPIDFPQGPCDLGIVLKGRTDTTLVKDAIKVVSPGLPKLLSFSPQVAGRMPFRGVISTEWFPTQAWGWTYALHKDRTWIPGRYIQQNRETLSMEFPVSYGMEAGPYELVAVTQTQDTLRLVDAITLQEPGIGRVPEDRLQIGKQGRVLAEILHPGFAMELISDPPTPGSSTIGPGYRTELERTALCRGSDCIEAVSKQCDGASLRAEFLIPPDKEPGIYDLVAVTATPVLTLEKKGAVLAAPPGYLPVTPKAEYGFPGPYWRFLPDEYAQWGMWQADTFCPLSGFALETPEPGLAYSDGIFSWKTALADTGWHYLKLASAGSCNAKAYLAVRIEDYTVTGIVRRNKSGRSAAAGPALLSIGPDSFRIRLDTDASAELVGLDGRRWAAYRGLRAGIGDLAIPAQAPKRGLLLCRVTGPNGRSWIRLLR